MTKPFFFVRLVDPVTGAQKAIEQIQNATDAQTAADEALLFLQTDDHPDALADKLVLELYGPHASGAADYEFAVTGEDGEFQAALTRTAHRTGPLAPWQRVVADTYGEGDYRGAADVSEAKDAGDGLYTFLMGELDEREGCETMEEAHDRVQTAIDQLNEIANALALALPKA